MSEHIDNLDHAQKTIQAITSELQRSVLMDRELLLAMGAAVLQGGKKQNTGNGHILLESGPGLAKTTLAKAFATSIGGGTFARVQGSPDIEPSDILGREVYNQKTGDFEFRPGPIFCSTVLADEINRSPEKTQAALFESMEENQVTAGLTTYGLKETFTVIATQNPSGIGSRVPLDPAAKDRFAIGGYLPDATAEDMVNVSLHKEKNYQPKKVVEVADILQARDVVAEIVVDDSERLLAANLVVALRDHEYVQANKSVLGSNRPILKILGIARAFALADGKETVLDEHVRRATRFTLPHRTKLSREASVDGGLTTLDVVDQVIASK